MVIRYWTNSHLENDLQHQCHHPRVQRQYQEGIFSLLHVRETGYGAPEANAEPPLGGYSDPEADILPEYFKSEISLGLNGASDVPRVEPFLSDYGVPQDTYAAASSFTPVAVESPARSVPNLTYGVPAAPTISLEDYNIPEVSDAGFSGVGGSSYGG